MIQFNVKGEPGNAKRVAFYAFWHSPATRVLIKTIALLITLTFVFPYLTWAFEKQTFMAGMSGIRFNQNLVFIPKKLGTVAQSFQGREQLIIHIQDLHCNQEVQLNIAGILDHLSDQFGLRLVAVEGAAQPVRVDKLSTFPVTSVKKEVARHFIKEGKVTGPEYFAATAPRAIHLEGIENPDYFRVSREKVLGFLNDESQGYVFDLRDALEELKPRIYAQTLSAHDHYRSEFMGGRRSLLSYCAFLYQAGLKANISLEAFTQLKTYVSLRQQVFPLEVDSDQLYQEIERLERYLRQNLYTTEAEQELDSLLHRLEVVEKLLSIAATPEELKEYWQYQMIFQVRNFVEFISRYDPAGDLELDPEVFQLDATLERVKEFYQLADRRSLAFANNTLERMRDRSARLAVLVTGGFHTNMILETLRKQGISYMSVKPRVSRFDTINPYFALLRERKTPLEKLLAQNQDILSLPTAFPQGDPKLAALENLQPGQVRTFLKLLDLTLKEGLITNLIQRGVHELEDLAGEYAEVVSTWEKNNARIEVAWGSALANVAAQTYFLPVLNTGFTLVIQPLGAAKCPEQVLLTRAVSKDYKVTVLHNVTEEQRAALLGTRDELLTKELAWKALQRSPLAALVESGSKTMAQGPVLKRIGDYISNGVYAVLRWFEEFEFSYSSLSFAALPDIGKLTNSLMGNGQALFSDTEMSVLRISFALAAITILLLSVSGYSPLIKGTKRRRKNINWKKPMPRRRMPVDDEVLNLVEGNIEAGQKNPKILFAKCNSQLRTLIKSYHETSQGHQIGAAAKRLAYELSRLKDDEEFKNKMWSEKQAGKCKHFKKTCIVNHRELEMQIREYPDGTVVRYRPAENSYSIEIRKKISFPFSLGSIKSYTTLTDIACKVNSAGNLIPKSPRDVANPYELDDYKSVLYQKLMMDEGHYYLAVARKPGQDIQEIKRERRKVGEAGTRDEIGHGQPLNLLGAVLAFFVGLGVLGIGFLHPLAMLLTIPYFLMNLSKLMVTYRLWRELPPGQRTWLKFVAAYDPQNGRVMDSFGNVMQEMPWVVKAHDLYAHRWVQGLLKLVGIDIRKFRPNTPAHLFFNIIISEVLAHSLDLLAMPWVLFARRDKRSRAADRPNIPVINVPTESTQDSDLYAVLRSFAGTLGKARGKEEIFSTLRTTILQHLGFRAVNVYDLRTEPQMEYRSLERAGMPHSSSARDRFKSLGLGNEKAFVLESHVEELVTGVFEKTGDILHIEQRNRVPFVNQKELLRDIVVYSRAPRWLRAWGQYLAQSFWLPQSAARFLVWIIGRLRPAALARVNEALWIVMRDTQGEPDGLLLINNWENGRPLFSAGNKSSQLAVLAMLGQQTLAAWQQDEKARQRRTALQYVQTEVNQLNATYEGRLVSDEMREAIHSLRSGLVPLGFLPRLIKSISSTKAANKLRSVFESLQTITGSMNELLEAVRIADNSLRVGDQDLLTKAMQQRVADLQPDTEVSAVSLDQMLLVFSQSLLASKTEDQVFSAARTALGKAADKEGLAELIRQMTQTRLRQLATARFLRQEQEQLSQAQGRLRGIGNLLEQTRQIRFNLLAVRRIIDTVQQEQLSAVETERIPAADWTKALEYVDILLSLIHRVSVFEWTLKSVLRNQMPEARPLDMAKSVNRAVVSARTLLPRLTLKLLSNTEGPLVARVSPYKLEYTLMHECLYNALKYGASQVTVSVDREGEEVVIRLRDNGRGLTPERLREIQAAVTQGKALAPDTSVPAGMSRGIGLPEMARTLHLVGGSLEVSSAGAGQDTTVAFRLPLASEEKAAEPQAFEAIQEALNSATSGPRLLQLISKQRIFEVIPEIEGLETIRGGVAWENRDMLEFTRSLLETLDHLKNLASQPGIGPGSLNASWQALRQSARPQEELKNEQVQSWVNLYRHVAADPRREKLLWLVGLVLMSGKIDAELPEIRHQLTAITAQNIVAQYNSITGETLDAGLARKIVRHYALIGDYIMRELPPKAMADVFAREEFTSEDMALLALLSLAVIQNVGPRGRLNRTNLQTVLDTFTSLDSFRRSQQLIRESFADLRFQAWSLGEELPVPRTPVEAQNRSVEIQRAVEDLELKQDPGAYKSWLQFLNEVFFYHSYFLFNSLSPRALARLLYIVWQLGESSAARWVIFDTDRLPAGLQTNLETTSWQDLKQQLAQARQELEERQKTNLLGFALSLHEDQLLARLSPGSRDRWVEARPEDRKSRGSDLRVSITNAVLSLAAVVAVGIGFSLFLSPDAWLNLVSWAGPVAALALVVNYAPRLWYVWRLVRGQAPELKEATINKQLEGLIENIERRGGLPVGYERPAFQVLPSQSWWSLLLRGVRVSRGRDHVVSLHPKFLSLPVFTQFTILIYMIHKAQGRGHWRATGHKLVSYFRNLLGVHILVNLQAPLAASWRAWVQARIRAARKLAFRLTQRGRPVRLYVDFNETISQPRSKQSQSLRDIVARSISSPERREAFINAYNRARARFDRELTQEAYRNYYAVLAGHMTLEHAQERSASWELNENFLETIRRLQAATGSQKVEIVVVSRSGEQALHQFFQRPEIAQRLANASIRVNAIKGNRLVFNPQGVFTGEIIEDVSQPMIADNKQEFIPADGLFLGDHKDSLHAYRHFVNVNENGNLDAVADTWIREQLSARRLLSWRGVRAWLSLRWDVLWGSPAWRQDARASQSFRNLTKASELVTPEARERIITSLQGILQKHQATMDDIRKVEEISNNWSARLENKAKQAALELRQEVQNITRLDLNDVPDALKPAFWDGVLLTLLARHDQGFTFGHSWEVGNLAADMAWVYGRVNREAEYPAEMIELFRRGGWLHDAGKLLLPPSLLLNSNTLNQREKSLLRTHARLGEVLLGAFGYRPEILQGTNHHEWLNGMGYPRGLHHTDITEISRAIAVADTFRAMVERTRVGHRLSDILGDLLIYATNNQPRYDARWVATLGQVARRRAHARGTEVFYTRVDRQDKPGPGGWLTVAPIRILLQTLGAAVAGVLFGFWIFQDPALSSLTVAGAAGGLSLAAIHLHRLLLRQRLARSKLPALTREMLESQREALLGYLEAQGGLPAAYRATDIRFDVLPQTGRLHWWQRMRLGQGEQVGNRYEVRVHPNANALSLPELALIIRHELWEAYTGSHARATWSELFHHWFGTARRAFSPAAVSVRPAIPVPEMAVEPAARPLGLGREITTEIPKVIAAMQSTRALVARPNESFFPRASRVQRAFRYVLRSLAFRSGRLGFANFRQRLPLETLTGVLSTGIAVFRAGVLLAIRFQPARGIQLDSAQPELQQLLLENGLPDQTAVRLAAGRGLRLNTFHVAALNKDNRELLQGMERWIGGLRQETGQTILYVPEFLLASLLAGPPAGEMSALQRIGRQGQYQAYQYWLGLLVSRHAAAYQNQTRLDLVLSALQAQRDGQDAWPEFNLRAMTTTLRISRYLPSPIRSAVHAYWLRRNPTSTLNLALGSDTSVLAQELRNPGSDVEQAYRLYSQVQNPATLRLWLSALAGFLRDQVPGLTHDQQVAALDTLARLTMLPDLRGRTVGHWLAGTRGLESRALIVPEIVFQPGLRKIWRVLRDMLRPLPAVIDPQPEDIRPHRLWRMPGRAA